MARFFRSLTFRHALLYVALLVVLETVVFALLYWRTVKLYENRANAAIHAEVDELYVLLGDLTVNEMASLITLRCTDEPGEWDEYLLVGHEFEYIAGNVRKWPTGVQDQPGLADVMLGEAKQSEHELHRVRASRLPSGYYLLVGRNLTELSRLQDLMRRALIQTIVLTVILGFGGGYAYNRRVAARLDRINTAAAAILTGDLQRRMPVTPSGDEIDELSQNLNFMLDRIESLMDAMRAVTDNIAHDLRKPITRMRSRIELALMAPKTPEVYVEALTRTVDEIDELLKVFNALLTIALAESGAHQDFEPVDLADIVRSTAELYEPAAEEAGLKLELEIPEPIRCPGNPHLLSQAVANLIENTIKYAPGSGKVTIAADRTAEGPRVVVTDRGPGIPDGFRDKALDRFTRLEDSRSTPGSGLGLSLVRAVARMHGGLVELQENHPGLRVVLTLPDPTTQFRAGLRRLGERFTRRL